MKRPLLMIAAAFLGACGNASAMQYSVTLIDSLSGISGFETGSNNLGQVVGSSGLHAAIWNGSTATDLGTVGSGVMSFAYDINDAGQVVGASDTWGTTLRQAAIWNGTVGTALGLAGLTSAALAINNPGQVVGWGQVQEAIYYPADYQPLNPNRVWYTIWTNHAFVWNDTVATDLNTALFAIGAGWVLTEATGINDLGQIVGSATNRITGARQAFLLTPVPLPATAWLMLAGLGALGASARPRKTSTVHS
jgi:probable HAF family extracellular repeat protein